MVMNFSGKSAIVTGGANGIGLAIAQALAKGGAQVWIFDLEREDPCKVAAGFGAQACVVDVRDRTSLDAAFTRPARQISWWRMQVSCWRPISRPRPVKSGSAQSP